MTIKTILFGTILLLGIGCGDAPSQQQAPPTLTSPIQTGGHVQLLPPADFEAAFKKADHANLIDVRTPEEFAAGALPNAVNIDYKAADFKDKMGQLDKTKPVFLYCAKGGRSADAAAICTEIGFTEVYDMQGGYTAWSAAGQ